jgi:hypothetical protein
VGIQGQAINRRFDQTGLIGDRNIEPKTIAFTGEAEKSPRLPRN